MDATPHGPAPIAAQRGADASASGAGAPLLDVQGLDVVFRTAHGPVTASRDVSLAVRAGETLGLVGESGSGKSVFCRAVMRLLPSPPAKVSARRLAFDGIDDLLALPERRMRAVRGVDIAMVFQNPMTALSPVWPVGDQIAEGLRVHRGLTRTQARDAGIALLARTGIPEPARRFDDLPWQWSGGMLQRAVIAMATACGPKLLLADEPTTALDVTIQAQILGLLAELQRESGMALVLVSHDIGVVAQTCDRIAVMYAGSVVETGPTRAVFASPRHPYTAGLLRSSPRVDTVARRLDAIPGQPPDLAHPPPGCAFAPRCARARDACTRAGPLALREVAPQRASACLFADELGAPASSLDAVPA
jgi:oligopeptide/dipeptide ABC transporter ATP-binding protein